MLYFACHTDIWNQTCPVQYQPQCSQNTVIQPSHSIEKKLSCREGLLDPLYHAKFCTNIRRTEYKKAAHDDRNVDCQIPTTASFFFVWFCLSVHCLFVIATGDQLWWSIPSGSLPLYCFNLQLLFFIVVNKIFIYLSIYLSIQDSTANPEKFCTNIRWTAYK